MTAYSPIANSEIDPESAIVEELFRKFRDNPIAMAEGALGAQRIYIGALQRLAAGTVVRSRKDATQNRSDTSYARVYGFAFLQAGTVRVVFEYRRDTCTSMDIRLRRTRGESTTTLGSWNTSSTSFQSQTVDASVLPGDDLFVEAQCSGGGVTYEVRNIRVQTNGEDMYPGAAMSLEGNTFN